jgi:hypothetical protein
MLVFLLERREERIPNGEPVAHESECDGVGLVDVRDVLGDAEDVSRWIQVVRERVRLLLPFENGDGFDDDVSTVASDGYSRMALGVVASGIGLGRRASN